MGASMKATVLPGRAISWDGASATGWTTLTIGMAASWVARVTLASAFTRERMPKKITSATTAMALAGIHQEMRGEGTGGAAAGWAAATAPGLVDSISDVSTVVEVSRLFDSAFICIQTSPWAFMRVLLLAQFLPEVPRPGRAWNARD